MPTRLCLERSCPHPATYRGRCAQHGKARNRDTHRNRHVYNSARWKYLRRRVLFDQPLCPCGAIATDVHHIQDLDKGGAPYARANVTGLCRACHSRITRQEQENA